MDNVTHSLVGLMLARAVLDRGEKGAAIMVVLAANAPDIDGISFFSDTLTYLEQHRGYVHSLAFAPLVALIPLLLVKLVTWTRITLWSYFACVVAVLSHLMLDWTNVYGVRLMLPFSAHWFHLDVNPLAEPFILLILVLSWAIPALMGLIGGYQIGGEQRGKVAPAPRRAWAIFALIAITAYDTARWRSHERAISMMAAKSYYREAEAEKIYAFPPQFGFSPLVWRGIVEIPGAIYDLTVDVNRPLYVTPDKMHPTVEHTPVNDLAMDTALGSRAFRVFESFNQVPFWILRQEQNATRVQLLDLRFGSLGIPGFRAEAVVRWPTGELLESRFAMGGR